MSALMSSHALQTPRLSIRPFVSADLDALHCVLSDPVTMQFWPAPFTREQSALWLFRNIAGLAESGLGHMALILGETGALVGDCGIVRSEIDGTPENDLGYIVQAAYWGHGYGTEAAATLAAYGFETLRLTRLCANMPADHVASRRVAEKIGMHWEKEFRNARNRDIRTCIYSLERKKAVDLLTA